MSFYITTPLYYVNDLPHIGSAYPTMATDFFAGHMLQRGEDVCFLTGTDEHGQKIEKAAVANNKSPQEHCDYIASEFEELWKVLNIEYDFFRRTSAQDHKDFVKEFFRRVYDNGDIYKAEYKGLYCVSCEDFKLEKDLEEIAGELCCPTHKQKVESYSQENYFFALSKYEDKLRQHIKDNPNFICPEYRRNEVLGWVEDGLRDFPISRVGIEWGISIPLEEAGDQKIYVWFDALLGYISGLGESRSQYWAGPGEEADDKQIVHIIGKDILRFHAVYWPAMLWSAGYQLPTKVFGHGFLTKDGMKMGKTLGNIIDPIALTQEYGADAVRFYFLREIVFGKDGDFTEANMLTRLNADFANNLGNLLNRSCNLLKKYSNYELAPRYYLEDEQLDFGLDALSLDAGIATKLSELESKFVAEMDKLNPHTAIDEIFFALNEVNAYVNEVEPWRLLKLPAKLLKEQGSFGDGDKEELKPKIQQGLNCLYTAVEACRRAALLLAPLTPELSSKIYRQLNLLGEADYSREDLLTKYFVFDSYAASLKQGHKIREEISPIFERKEAAALAPAAQ